MKFQWFLESGKNANILGEIEYALGGVKNIDYSKTYTIGLGKKTLSEEEQNKIIEYLKKKWWKVHFTHSKDGYLYAMAQKALNKWEL